MNREVYGKVISFVGIIAFAIQEIPYIIMPLIKLKSNPIMNMQNDRKNEVSRTKPAEIWKKHYSRN